ncbi:hypothetical protein JG687_00014832 [Phytophthora cactorum]|uniref:Retrovirus-related Pol polyprotein from transposon TNT 1-94-like beta-barrel domain-containing protein n=1 Tax=Phytophthora cactorum TaxID=29920 RepID=A0A8T1TYD2_9STRA|nr:hypothetical protein JG687_00014832 [Phytophthora cactorum]
MVQSDVCGSSPGDWMLDSGSTTHVCRDRSLFTSEKKSLASFRVWTGDVTRGVMSGSVLLHVRNGGGNDVLELPLENVEYSPHGSTSLLILGRMEKNGWRMSTNSPEEKVRLIVLDKDNQRLVFLQQVAHYWLRTVDAEAVTEGMAMLTVNSDASPR